MKIKSLNLISYGKFKDFKLELSDGVNLICGKNESGKSTIMSFIRAMIYGFSGRGMSPENNERKRYLPWGGTSMSGEICLSDDKGNTVRVYRKSGRSQGLDLLEAINSAGEKVHFDGSAFVGIGENAFEKTFYIKQQQSSVVGEDEEIAKKLINLISSGEEDTSYHGAAQALKDEIKKYKSTRSGILDDLKKALAAVHEEKEEAELFRKTTFEYSRKSEELSRDIENYRHQLAEMSKQLEEAQKTQDNDKAAEQKILLDSIRAVREAQAEELKSAGEELSALKIYEQEADKIIYESVPDEKHIAEKLEESKKERKKLKAGGFLLLFAAALSAAAGGILNFFAFAFTAVFAFLGLIVFRKLGDVKKDEAEYYALKEKKDRIQSELAKYNAEDLRDYTEKRSRYMVIKSRRDELLKKYEQSAEKYKKAAAAYESISAEKQKKNQALEEIGGKERTVRELLEAAIEEKSRIDGFLSAGTKGRSIDIILTEEARLVRELECAAAEYEALLLAKETLDEVYTEFCSDFTPKVSARASEILSEITGGTHTEMIIDKKYDVTMGMGGIRPLGFFSAGTKDQAYLAVRLAVSDILFAGRNPVILDDVLIQYDEERQLNTMKMLKKRAEEGQQIIICSCKPIAGEGMNVIQL